MKNLRLHWDALAGWMIDVPTLLTEQQIDRIAKWAVPFQFQRYIGLPPGEKKHELGRAIDLLKKGNIQQRLIDDDGDGILTPFKSTEKATRRSYFYG